MVGMTRCISDLQGGGEVRYVRAFGNLRFCHIVCQAVNKNFSERDHHGLNVEAFDGGLKSKTGIKFGGS